MRHILYAHSDTYPIALLVKESAFRDQPIREHYTYPLVQQGCALDELIAFSLKYDENGKASAKFIKAYLDELLPGLQELSVKYLFVTDGAYFKVLTKKPKADPHIGYVLPCAIEGYEHMHVVLGVNHQAMIYNPDLKTKLAMGLEALASHHKGNYQALGSSIIHSASYPRKHSDILTTLQGLHQYPVLTCDIEAFSLRFEEAGIATIAFAWDRHNGTAFACDYVPYEADEGDSRFFGMQGHNEPVRRALKAFFEAYQGKLIWHNSVYDLKVLIYNLWMRDPLDTKGLLEGLEVMARLFDDTKIIAYLATNSTAGNELSLKDLAHPFAGNWAMSEINDVRLIPLDDLLQYNLIDTLSTHYVNDTYYPVMVADDQEELYNTLFKPSLPVIIQMELSGMPMSQSQIRVVKQRLEEIQAAHINVIRKSPVIQKFNQELTLSAWEKDFEDRKAKAKNPDKIKAKDWATFPVSEFNPNSGPQMQRLFYEVMGLPIIDLTDTKQPATGADTIEKLINHTQVAEHRAILEALIGYGKVDKILTAFIPNFEKALSKSDGMVYLHGSFNLGGTVSGRLSSSKPNMQQIPANSEYGKLIKSCFAAPKGWILAGADFSSLEDRINALLTKDPQKIKVYTDQFDGHSLRAYAYFNKQMPDIRQVTPDQNLRTFKVTVDGQEHFLCEGDTVQLPDGSIKRIETLC